MNTSLLGSIVLAALGTGGLAGAVVVARESQRRPPDKPLEPGLANAVHGLTSEIGKLEQRIAGLEQQLVVGERVELAPAARPSASAEQAAAPEPAPETASDAGGASGDLATKLDELLEWGVRAADVNAFFEEIRKAGNEDEIIAALEDRIARDPSDARLQYLLAKACYARLMLESSPAGYERWGARTVSAWDRAIALDPSYWEPRYERAEYFTYFPESEGKTPGLIAELQALIELQAGSTANPAFAHTYAHLARLYLRLGKTAEALEALTAGTALFPDDAELHDLLEALTEK